MNADKMPNPEHSGAEWSGLAGQLWALPAGAWPESVAATLAADIALSAALEQSAPDLPFSLAAGLSRQVAAEAGEGHLEAAEPLAALLRAQPYPELPTPQAKALAWAIAREAGAQKVSAAPATPAVPASAALKWRANSGGATVFAGLSVLLATGGLSVLGQLGTRGWPVAQHAAQQGASLGLLASPVTATSPLLGPLTSPTNLLGLALLIVSSALLVWRPSRPVRRGAAMLLALAAVLTLPAVWDSLHGLTRGLGLSQGLQMGEDAWRWAPLVVSGLLLQMALLLLGGQAGALVRRQAHFPLQTLAAGTLAELGLLGLGLLLLQLGWGWAAPLLGFATLLAAVVGLGVSLLSLGRSLRQHLLPAAPRWLAGLTSLGIYGASLGLPPLAALLLLLGGAWGLGSVVTAGRGLLVRNNSNNGAAGQLVRP